MYFTTSGTTAQTEHPVFTVNRNGNRKPRENKATELPAFKTLPINQAFEQAKTTIENQKNLFGDLLTEGDLCIMFGRSNVGKSFLSYQIGEAISRGKNVLNMIDVVSLKNHGETKYYNLNNESQAQKILYVDFEGTIEKNYIRYSNREAGKTATPYQFSENFITAFPERLSVIDSMLFIDSIEKEVIKTGAKVVIIDNMSAISQDNEKSGNAVRLMNKIKDFQRKNKLTVLLMAHTPKILQGEPIIGNNLAGSSNLFNLADAVFAFNTTTIDESVRYIKQLKSRYNEIVYNQDNVITLKFTCRQDGFKGFEFLGYEPEEELIKVIDKGTKQDEDRQIIGLCNEGYGATKISELLKSDFAPDIDLNTYKQRIKKRIQRLRAKGLIKSESEQPEPEKTESEPQEQTQTQTSKQIFNSEEVKQSVNPVNDRTQRVLSAIGYREKPEFTDEEIQQLLNEPKK